MSALTAEDLRRHRRRVEAVPMPEWGEGEIVHVCEMAALESLRYARTVNAEIQEHGPLEGNAEREMGLMDMLLERCICTPSGERLFGDGELDIDVGYAVKERLYQAAARLNGLTSTAAESAEGNSAATPPGGLRIA